MPANNSASPPTDRELLALVDEALTLRAEIAKKTERLKEVEALIEAAALKGPHEPLKDADREGRQFLARAASGRVLPVIFTSDALIKSFQDKSEKHQQLEALAGSTANLARLFKRPSKWESRFDDGKKFRAAANELLGNTIGVQFITACRQVDSAGLAKSATKFDWDHAR